jgi:Uma2 family endonuclease
MSSTLAPPEPNLVVTEVLPQSEERLEDDVKSGLHLWTRAEYHRMAELGLFDDRRVELLDGRIWNMAPQLTPHATCVRRAARKLREIFGTDCLVEPQLPVTLGDGSEPEPDIAVIPGLPEDYLHEHPTPHQILLLVEVSDSTLRKDRGQKAQAYARAGIVDYWIVNLVDRRLEAYRDPTPEGIYQSIRLLGPERSLAPLHAPDKEILVAELLPPLAPG